jgi:hypothetical protein
MMLLLDWRSTGRWGLPSGLLLPLAAGRQPPAYTTPRFVWRWACLHCERHYVGTNSEPQPCLTCGRVLAYVGSWDLRAERAPRWGTVFDE